MKKQVNQKKLAQKSAKTLANFTTTKQILNRNKTKHHMERSKIINYQIHFTMQHLHLLEYLAETFQCHVHNFQGLTVLVKLAVRGIRKPTPLQLVPPGLPSIENGTHGTKKLLLKTQVSEDFAQRSKSNKILQCKINVGQNDIKSNTKIELWGDIGTIQAL